MTAIFYLSILMVIKLFKADVTFFYCFVSCVISCCRNITHNRFNSSSKCSINFSAQSLHSIFSMNQQYQNQQQTCYVQIIQTVHVLLSFLYMVSSLFALSSFGSSFLYFSSIGLNMLSKFAYNINGTLGWFWPSWNSNHSNHRTWPLLLWYS